MGFKFRYEALMGYRHHLKEKAEIEYSRAQQEVRQLVQGLEAYQEDFQATRNDMTSALRQKTDSVYIKSYSQYLGALKIWIAVKEADIAKAEKAAAEKLEVLLAATKDFKIIEKLKEKDYEKWKNKLNMLEQKQLSETGVLRHGRVFL